MVAIANDQLVFSRDQVVTATQASKNFGEIRRRAKRAPLFVSDRNARIDTVIVDFEEFESMAVELERLRSERFYAVAARRIADAEGCGPEGPSLEETLGEEGYKRFLGIDPNTERDEDLFERAARFA